MSTLPDPNPWLQYGALGLLALVLVGLAGFLIVAAKVVGSHVTNLVNSLNAVTNKLSEVMTQLAANDAYTRAKLESISDGNEHITDRLDDLVKKQRDKSDPPKLPRRGTGVYGYRGSENER